MSQPRQLLPVITLQEIYPAEAVFCVRGSFHDFGWSAPDPTARDRATAGSLTLSGGTSILCARAAATELGLRLLEAAGFPPCGPLLTYRDGKDFATHVSEMTPHRKKLAYQLVHAPRERPATSYFVPRRLLTYLNDKGNLAELVPTAYVPQRTIVPVEDLARADRCFRRFPMVFKAVSAMPSASAQAVVIANNECDIARARQRFCDCKFVVVEEFLDIRRNFCLNFATTRGGPRFIGAALQVTDRDGGYHGNWLEPDIQPPPEAVEVGLEITRQAAARGYHGLAGFDMTIDGRKRIHVIDLNFRINGCTAAVVWQDAARRRFGQKLVGRVLRLTMQGHLAGFESPIRLAMRAGTLLPLGFFDTAVCESRAIDSSVTALILGHSRSIVRDRLRALSRHGLYANLPVRRIDAGRKSPALTEIAPVKKKRQAA